MRIIVIGGTGHIGTYLIPRLIADGHEVVSVSRNQRAPYQKHRLWDAVQTVTLDRLSMEAEGLFAKKIAELEPEIVVDLICFTPDSARQLVTALRGKVRHFLHCGTIWVHGHSVQVPTKEFQPRAPFGEYGINKAAIEAFLLREAHREGFPATLLHPGHIVGPGWLPVNPAGNLNPDIFRRLATGKALDLPNLGMETLHHVHADDVAHAFVQAIRHRNVAVGEAFHVVSPEALTLRGYAEEMFAWFGRKPDLRFLPWEDWKKTVSEEDAALTWDHIAHSPNCSIGKATELIAYRPRYSSLQAIQEAITWQIEQGHLNVTG